MDDKEKRIELIKEIAGQSPGFKANEDLLDEIVEESVKRLESFLETSTSQTSIEIYIKKIVRAAVIDIAKNAEKIRREKSEISGDESNDFQVNSIKYETDEHGKIIYDIEIEQPEKKPGTGFSDEKIKTMKEKIIKLDRQNPEKKYRKVFEMRFLEEGTYQDIARKLKIEEKEILKTLQEIFKEINLSVAS